MYTGSVFALFLSKSLMDFMMCLLRNIIEM